ncbi:MAG: hypothetical protein K0Q83_2509, partial [Deltaproteobacteria bacterium]|nr:hypothetical protein [Deltaproteobacteria bacterium]
LMLAKLLKADLLPTVWIPPENQRHIRELLTHRVCAWCVSVPLPCVARHTSRHTSLQCVLSKAQAPGSLSHTANL